MSRELGSGLVSAAAAAGLALVVTRGGLLLNPDSPTYLWTSRLIRSDISRWADLPSDTALSVSGSFPPFYPMVLAAAGSLGDDLVTGRIVGVALAAVTAGLLVRLVARHSSVTVGLVVGLVVFVSRAYVLVLFGFLMSDGLYVALCLTALTLLEPTLEDRAPTHPMLRAGGAFVVASLALGTRFVGVGLVVAVAFITLTMSRLGGGNRRAAALGLVVGVAPLAVWHISDSGGFGVGGAGVGEFRVGWYPPITAFLRAGDSLVWSYAPRPLGDLLGPNGVRTVGVALFAALLWWSASLVRSAVARDATADVRVAGALLSVGWAHLGMLVMSRLLIDPFIEADGRQPMLWLTCLVAAGGIDVHRRATASERPVSVRPFAAVAAAMVLAASGPFAGMLLHPGDAWWHLAKEGRSELASDVGRLPAATVVYTNREDIIYLQSGHRTKTLTLPRVRHSTHPNPEFVRRTELMGAAVARGGSVVAVFDGDPYWSVSVPELRRITGLDVVHRSDDGVILAADPIVDLHEREGGGP